MLKHVMTKLRKPGTSRRRLKSIYTELMPLIRQIHLTPAACSFECLVYCAIHILVVYYSDDMNVPPRIPQARRVDTDTCSILNAIFAGTHTGCICSIQHKLGLDDTLMALVVALYIRKDMPGHTPPTCCKPTLSQQCIRQVEYYLRPSSILLRTATADTYRTTKELPCTSVICISDLEFLTSITNVCFRHCNWCFLALIRSVLQPHEFCHLTIMRRLKEHPLQTRAHLDDFILTTLVVLENIPVYMQRSTAINLCTCLCIEWFLASDALTTHILTYHINRIVLSVMSPFDRCSSVRPTAAYLAYICKRYNISSYKNTEEYSILYPILDKDTLSSLVSLFYSFTADIEIICNQSVQ